MIGTMWILIIELILVIITIAMFVIFIVNALVWTKKKICKEEVEKQRKRMKRYGLFTVAGIAFMFTIGWISQKTAFTPKIRDEHGNPIPGSIATLEQVELNGRKEWISIRGVDKTKPILLFLAGGPGGSQMSAVRYELSELEKYFVVVNWDQPGSGKSYGAISSNKITPETYIKDGYALTKYLCERFEQEKIYLIGESWGSALGIFLVERYPEAYHGYIGTGQMVAFEETEKIDYKLAMQLAKEEGNDKLVRKLEKNGEPPYYNEDVTWKSVTYLNYLNQIMTKNPKITNGGFQTMKYIAASEYGMLDKINYLRGIVTTFNTVYPQLYEIDLRNGYTNLQVPVYFFLGEHDINAPISLAKEYYELLQAPKKELIWFEHSGHSPWTNESDKFVQEVLRVFQ